MCLGIPGRVVGIEPAVDLARVDVAGVVREINIMLLDDRPAVGEYILIHSGFALERMTAEQAQDALAVFDDGSMTGRPEWSGSMTATATELTRRTHPVRALRVPAEPPRLLRTRRLAELLRVRRERRRRRRTAITSNAVRRCLALS